MSKLFKNEDVLSSIDYEEAASFLNILCYFGNCQKELEDNIKDDNKVTLKQIDGQRAYSYKAGEDSWYALCIPCDKVNGAEMNKYDEPKAKLFELRDVFCFANAEKAKGYIGKDCYFGSSLEDLAHSVEQDYNCFSLHSIDLVRDDAKVFVADTGVDFEVASYCLPKEKVIRPDAKYRPFKDLGELADFLETSVYHLAGKNIHYKSKATGKEHISVISSVCLSDNRVRFDGWSNSLVNMFNECELWNGEKWIPFGVKEK